MSLPIVARRDPREVLWGYAASSYSVDARFFLGRSWGRCYSAVLPFRLRLAGR